MIKADKYDFVNIDCPKAIYDPGYWFTQKSLMPTYEGAAYALEVYNTYKMKMDYKIYVEDRYIRKDKYPTVPPKSNIPMMNTRKIWYENLKEIKDWINGAGKREKYFGSNVLVYKSGIQLESPQNVPIIDYTTISNHCLQNSGTVDIKVKDGMMSFRDCVQGWYTVANLLYSPQYQMHKPGTVIFTGYNAHADYSGGILGGGHIPFSVESIHWEKNGARIDERNVPQGFLNKFMISSERPPMYYEINNGGETSEYCQEGSFYFTWSEPPWTSGRVNQTLAWVEPIWEIRVCPTWKFTKAGSPTIYGVEDKAFAVGYWVEDNYTTGPVTLDGPGLNGGKKYIENSRGTWRELCKHVFTAANVMPFRTQPSQQPPAGYGQSGDGYKAYVDIAACIFFRLDPIKRAIDSRIQQ